MNQRRVLEISEPFTRMACDVLRYDMPSFLIGSNGMEIVRSPRTVELLTRIESLRQEAIYDAVREQAAS